MIARRAAQGRLPLLQAALVVARRDFAAVLFGRAFVFFLIGPLFPVVVMALAGGVGAQIQNSAPAARIGLVMDSQEMEALLAARAELAARVPLPHLVETRRLAPGERFDAAAALAESGGELAAILTGTLAAPRLIATSERLEQWAGPVSFLAAHAARRPDLPFPQVATSAVASSAATQKSGRIITAQGAQVLLFLLIMMLASMVLSNLVEEKGNKIIEVLAAAIPMEAVFLGKLFAMLAISLVGLAVWGSVAGLILAAGGFSLAEQAAPGVGWAMLALLFLAYFAMGYLLLGAVFLTIGSQAKTVREVQTLAMPASMLQIVVFFLASLTITSPDGLIARAGAVFPLSSPFVMLGRAAMEQELWPHALALIWQAVWVLVFVRVGARLFRQRVLQSGRIATAPAGPDKLPPGPAPAGTGTSEAGALY